jgi:hypothetical protein
MEAEGDADACHPQRTTKATEPYGIAEAARSAREVFDRGIPRAKHAKHAHPAEVDNKLASMVY